MSHEVLIVEDEPDIADLIRVNLEELGLKVTHSSNGREALSIGKQAHFDLMLLDIMLPEVNGIDICREIRSIKPCQAIIMLTSKDSETDRVLGLELGADDYMTKPFSIRELQARVRAQLRRFDAIANVERKKQTNNEICVGCLTINLTKHEVLLDSKVLDLTTTEFDLLLHFAKHPNQVFSRAQLLESVWGYHHSGYEHTVNSHINRLRAKLEADAANPKIIQTVWGVGYKLNLKSVCS